MISLGVHVYIKVSLFQFGPRPFLDIYIYICVCVSAGRNSALLTHLCKNILTAFIFLNGEINA